MIVSTVSFAQDPRISNEYFSDMLDFFDSMPRGDSAVAERYALWARDAIEQGLWAEALAGLERASDFADLSSDISYLLALARYRADRSRLEILEALEQAIHTERWNMYTSEDARLFKAEQLIALRAYAEALAELAWVDSSPAEAELSLMALANLRPVEFRRYMIESLDRYPRESGPVRVFLKFVKNEEALGHNPTREDIEILELIFRRLPLLLDDDPELAWMAAPFMRDHVEARRLLSAYRALHPPLPGSIPVALNLGVIDEQMAMEELFAFGRIQALDLAILEEVWALLRTADARTVFRRNLSVFSGVITEDANGDGIPETRAEYYNGSLTRVLHDATQEGVPQLIIFLEAAVPSSAMVLLPPESRDTPLPLGARPPAQKEAELRWERYPAVLDVELDGARYIPRPLDFHFSPFDFFHLWGSGVLFPQRDPWSAPLTRRALVFQSLRVERPSLEFDGGTEVVELSQGIPIRAREFVGDLMVAETEFLQGRPQRQRVDLDFDGQMDIIRYFRRSDRPMELEELWDYDRDIEYVYAGE
ncbi:MAG: hypothetical protein FWH19_01660 [Treponema sp.]|nr:hypothetical protein [Treponema sp.]